jgi:hypothetical protein
MWSPSAKLSSLNERVEILPELVVKTRAQLPDLQKGRFDAKVKNVVGGCLRALRSNVADFGVSGEGNIERAADKFAGLKEKPGSESQHLIYLLNLIEKHLDPKNRSGLETKVASIVNNCVASLTKQVDELNLKGSGGIKADWHDLHRSVEALLRQLEVLNPTDEQEFVAGLWWMSQRGRSVDLDQLFKVRATPPYSSRGAVRALGVAEQGIIKRECKELLAFFDLSPAQLARVIKATIEKCRAVTSPYLKKAYNAERPTQVIRRLREIKQSLRDLFEPARIKRWLETPLESFDGKTPRQALLDGQTFPILHLLKRFDEGPHY